MKKIQWWLVVVLLAAALSPPASMSKDTITWPFFSHPPLYIIQGDKISGIGIEIQNMLWQHIPEYDHKRKNISVQRMFENMKHGHKYCVIGALKKPEREEFLHYSLPCRLEFPDGLIIRKSDLPRYRVEDEVSLETLMKSKRFVLGVIKGIRIEGKLDAVIREYGGNENLETISGENSYLQLFKMLVNRRVDGFIANPATAKKAGFEDQIAILPLKENRDSPIIGYAVCPKNEWGKQVIEKVNAGLKKIIPTQEYYDIYTPWIEEQYLPRFKELFEDHLVKPIKQSPESR